jgi:hypothetical protein
MGVSIRHDAERMSLNLTMNIRRLNSNSFVSQNIRRSLWLLQWDDREPFKKEDDNRCHQPSSLSPPATIVAMWHATSLLRSSMELVLFCTLLLISLGFYHQVGYTHVHRWSRYRGHKMTVAGSTDPG